MEYANEGDLMQIIKSRRKQKNYFSNLFVKKLIICLVEGVYCLHYRNIYHRDIKVRFYFNKSANVFLFQNGEIKIGDLNVSKVSKRGLAITQTGTPYYASPEVWKELPYDGKSDVWSIGCVIYESTTLEPPFKSKSMEELYDKILAAKIQPIPKHFSPEIYELIKWILNPKDAYRPSSKDIIQSKVYRKIRSDVEEAFKTQVLNKILNKSLNANDNENINENENENVNSSFIAKISNDKTSKTNKESKNIRISDQNSNSKNTKVNEIMVIEENIDNCDNSEGIEDLLDKFVSDKKISNVKKEKNQKVKLISTHKSSIINIDDTLEIVHENLYKNLYINKDLNYLTVDKERKEAMSTNFITENLNVVIKYGADKIKDIKCFTNNSFEEEYIIKNEFIDTNTNNYNNRNNINNNNVDTFYSKCNSNQLINTNAFHIDTESIKNSSVLITTNTNQKPIENEVFTNRNNFKHKSKFLHNKNILQSTIKLPEKLSLENFKFMNRNLPSSQYDNQGAFKPQIEEYKSYKNVCNNISIDNLVKKYETKEMKKNNELKNRWLKKHTDKQNKLALIEANFFNQDYTKLGCLSKSNKINSKLSDQIAANLHHNIIISVKSKESRLKDIDEIYRYKHPPIEKSQSNKESIDNLQNSIDVKKFQKLGRNYYSSNNDNKYTNSISNINIHNNNSNTQLLSRRSQKNNHILENMDKIDINGFINLKNKKVSFIGNQIDETEEC